MDLSVTIAVFLISVYIIVESSLVVNRNNEEECVLDNELVKEIASYQNVTKSIMEDIINGGSGEKMYQEYTRFIDKFGARPSGTENLERAIEMIKLIRQNKLKDVTTEELEVPHWERLYESAKMLQPRSQNIALLGLGRGISTLPEVITAEVIVINSFEVLDKTDRKDIKDVTIFIRQGISGASLVTQEEKYFWFHHSQGDTLTVQNQTDVIECAAFWAAFTYVIADLFIDIPRN